MPRLMTKVASIRICQYRPNTFVDQANKAPTSADTASMSTRAAARAQQEAAAEQPVHALHKRGPRLLAARCAGRNLVHDCLLVIFPQSRPRPHRGCHAWRGFSSWPRRLSRPWCGALLQLMQPVQPHDPAQFIIDEARSRRPAAITESPGCRGTTAGAPASPRWRPILAIIAWPCSSGRCASIPTPAAAAAGTVGADADVVHAHQVRRARHHVAELVQAAGRAAAQMEGIGAEAQQPPDCAIARNTASDLLRRAGWKLLGLAWK